MSDGRREGGEHGGRRLCGSLGRRVRGPGRACRWSISSADAHPGRSHGEGGRVLPRRGPARRGGHGIAKPAPRTLDRRSSTPESTRRVVIGTAPLVVPSNGPVYMAYGPVPPWPEELGLEEPECWRYDRGEDLLGEGWDERLCGELEEPYWYELLEFLADERGRYDVFPPPSQTFKAFELTPYDEVKVVILGQDPYPNPGRHTDWRSRCPRRSSGRPLAEEHPQGPRGRPFQDLGPARDRARAREPGRVGGPRRSAIEHRSDGARWLQEGPRASIHSDANRRDQTSCSATSTG